MPSPRPQRKNERFHGRVRHAEPRACEWPGCEEAGEFRAPKSAHPERDGYHWYCLDHVRAFNAAYDYHKQATPEDLRAATSGHPSWQGGSRPFASNAEPGRRAGQGGDRIDLDDPMAILRDYPGFGARFTARATGARAGDGASALSARDRAALATLGLEAGATPADIKKRYKTLVRRYHPDSNGGDRSQEHQLHKVIDAYTQLVRSPAFAERT
ncbi:DnaJ domain-containing protein [Parapedomonas caeni]